MKMYKDSALTIPALCPLRGMAQCVSECVWCSPIELNLAAKLEYQDFRYNKYDCVIGGEVTNLLYAGEDESRTVDGRE